MNISLQNFLPHQAPMLMVDTVLEISDTHVVTEFLVKENCIFLDENFLAESGLIENMAQTCSAIVGQFYFTNENSDKRILGYISAIKKLDIYALPKVLNKVHTEAHQLSRFDLDGYSSICSMRCEAFWGETILASAEMNLFIKELTDEKK
ncbi:MAG: acyl carrier protein [Capnocytophaga sp.]|nr:acyl carrier protein [Capnocytophaga sp.]